MIGSMFNPYHQTPPIIYVINLSIKNHVALVDKTVSPQGPSSSGFELLIMSHDLHQPTELAQLV